MSQRVKDIFEKTGVGRETLRFYEKKGLLPQPMRTVSGYREFPDAVIHRIKFIKITKEAGFTLKEIKELIYLRERTIDCKSGRQIAKKKKEEILDKIRSMKKVVAHLENFIKSCSKEDKTCSISFIEGCND